MSQDSERSIFDRLSSDSGMCEEVSHDSDIRLDESALERAFKAKDLEEREETLRGHKQDREQRKAFSARIFVFMCAYMAVSLVLVALCGCKVLTLSDSILITLLTTSLANVIGVFNFVAKYLFHKA